jgi:signal transduction histidine kinase
VTVRRRPELLVALAALADVTVPLALSGGPHGTAQWFGATAMTAGAAALSGWRRFPVAVLVGGPPLLLAPLFLGPEPSDFLLLVMLAYAALAAERFSGRAAVVAGGAYVAYLTTVYVVSGERNIGLVMLTLPGFLAGTALRLRRETAEQLALRGLELDAERELLAEVSVRNERARIASELHDIVGHALSVMVVQAAAGQRLVERDPAAASASLEVIAASAHQGRADLQRLVDLLTGAEVTRRELSAIDELVEQAARSGLEVSCRWDGARDGVDPERAHVAYRLVQEGLTNALRHAPGAAVRVLVSGLADGGPLTVQVENGGTPAVPAATLQGTGRGLIGLQERVLALGGTFRAGPCQDAGWCVEATLSRPDAIRF